MPRCANCGKANRDGAVYCQDCGQRIDGLPGAAPPAAATVAPVVVAAVNAGAGGMGGLPGGQAAPRPRAPEGPVCPSCGTVNPLGMNFCKMCGTGLVAAGRPASGGGQQAAPGRVNCPQCAKPTPSGYAFCQHCGHRLQAGGDAGAQAPVAGAIGRGRAEGVDKAMPPMPTPPAGVRQNAPLPVAAQAPVVQAQRVAVAPGYHPGPAPGQVIASTAAAHGGGQGLIGRLIAIRRDGTDGDVIPLTGESFDIGRSEGSLCFAEDPFLGPRHARFLVYGGVVRVRPLDTVNGVFLRLRDPHDLQAGDVFYIGKELVRFESLAAEERDPPSLVEHGVRLFGSAPRESWGRLRQITCAGTTRDMWYLGRPEIVLGREEGDITFPDDEFMSRRHAVLSRAGNRARLMDQNSSNGTYLRLRGDRELRPSDVLRMGDQLLRFEP